MVVNSDLYLETISVSQQSYYMWMKDSYIVGAISGILLGYTCTANISILEWASPGELGAGASNISSKGSKFG